MSCRHIHLAVAVTALLSGCSTLTRSIEQRVTVSEQCQLATSIAPANLSASEVLASIQLGNIGVCNVSKEHLLPMCAIDQIVVNGLSSAPDTQDSKVAQQNATDVTRFKVAVEDVRKAMHELATAVKRIDPDFRDVALTMSTGDINARANALGELARVAGTIQVQLATVRMKQQDLRGAVRRLDATLDARARRELAAWDANLDAHLARLGQALLGDYKLIIQEGVKDQVLTHVARRTLDLLHGSLKAPDALLRRLDDKSHGAVSISYLAFGSDLQDAVTQAFTRLDEANKIRQEQAEKSGRLAAAGGAWSKPLKMALRRAACENLLQGTQFSMLTELLDTMIIVHVEGEYPVLDAASAAKVVPASLPPIALTVAARSAPEGSALFTGLPAAFTLAPFQGSGTRASDSDIDIVATAAAAPPPGPTQVTPAGVHMAHVWAARQQLLVQAIAAKVSAAPAGSTAAELAYREVDPVDESAVQRLADAATAKSVDDAVRLSPGLLVAGAMDVDRQLINTVNVVTAATAVSSAAVTLKVNLSVSNVNTFNPTNYNNITPVINLAAPPALAPSIPSLCVSGDFGRTGTLCSRDSDAAGSALVISLAGAGFRDDSCAPSDLEPALTAIGRTIADYRARYGVEYMATIEGYASLTPARLTRCPKVAKAPASACHYVNHLRSRIWVTDCDMRSGDRNLALSAARARNAAQVIEMTGRGAVTVHSLVANGTRMASLRGEAPSADRTVVIRLQPRMPN